MSKECCENCKFYHRLKHNFQKGKGFQESYACDVLMYLPDSKHTGDFNVDPWIQEVDTHGMCEMFTRKSIITKVDMPLNETVVELEKRWIAATEYGNYTQEAGACRKAIEIINKYQKIQEIIDAWSRDGGAMRMSDKYWLGKIKGVLEEGND